MPVFCGERQLLYLDLVATKSPHVSSPRLCRTLSSSPFLACAWCLSVRPVYSALLPKLHQGDPENGVPPNPAYLRRSTVCKWLYLVGFLSDDIKRAPDDPQQMADLISGRARLKHLKK